MSYTNSHGLVKYRDLFSTLNFIDGHSQFAHRIKTQHKFSFHIYIPRKAKCTKQNL